MDGARSAEKVKRFPLTGLEMDGFLACEAFYENHILDSLFVNYFGPNANAHGQNATWACDMHYEYIERYFRKLSKM
jgi:hypothetical protein